MKDKVLPEIKITNHLPGSMEYEQCGENGLLKWCAYAIFERGAMKALIYREVNDALCEENRVVEITRYPERISTYVAHKAMLAGRQGISIGFIGHTVLQEGDKIPFSSLFLTGQIMRKELRTARLIPVVVREHIRSIGLE